LLDCRSPAAAFHDRQLFDGLMERWQHKKWIVYAKDLSADLPRCYATGPLHPSHRPFRAALQPFPKAESDAGTKAGGSRWLPSAPVTQNPGSQPALWYCPRCGGPISVARRLTAAQVPIKSYRFVMMPNTMPNRRLVPGTPTHSCFEHIPAAHVIALLCPNHARQATTPLSTHQIIGPLVRYRRRSSGRAATES
jgi:hypothetical protein